VVIGVHIFKFDNRLFKLLWNLLMAPYDRRGKVEIEVVSIVISVVIWLAMVMLA